MTVFAYLYVKKRTFLNQTHHRKDPIATMSSQKVILITVDGMRPDGFLASGSPYIEEMCAKSYYSLDAQSVVPPVTLPVHTSIFCSVPPARHGILTNTYVPQVHEVEGLTAILRRAKKQCAMFYGWEQLRDVTRPKELTYAEFVKARSFENSDTYLCERAANCLRSYHPDFLFLHLVETDEKGGHDCGWMSEEYLRLIRVALEGVIGIVREFAQEYHIIVEADHGGHDRTHGLEIPEDMTVPIFYFSPELPAGTRFHGGSLLDIAPTVADLMGVEPDAGWEGRSLIQG